MSLSFSPFPQLITERLSLRQLSLKDAEEIFALRSDEIVNKHLNRPKATSIEDAIAFINKINFAIDANQSIFWSICFKGESQLIGTICLWNFLEEENKAEIGYELLPQFHGKGIMQEAFLKVVEFGFQTLELNSIEAWTTVPNNGSIKILERNHFKRDQELESKIDRTIEGPELIIYSLSKEVFKQQVAI
jgi:ribosomal-protein-alanine N-acetyltransferase